MAASCKVCTSKHRAKIDRALVEKAESMRRIAAQYGIGEASIRRHSLRHLPARLVKANGAAETVDADILMAKIQDVMGTAEKVRRACDRYLSDPELPGEYTLDPRAEDVDVIFLEEAYEGNPEGKERGIQFRQRAKLSQLLDRSGKMVLGTQWRIADPRELVLKACLALDRQIRTLAQVAGLIQDNQTNITVNLTQQVMAQIPIVMKVLDRHRKVKSEVIEALEDAHRREKRRTVA